MINKALKVIRQFHKMKQTELSTELRLSKSYISEIESGKKPVSLEILQRYSDYFDIPVSSLMFFSESIEKKGKVSERFRETFAKKVIDIMEWVVAKDATEKAKV